MKQIFVTFVLLTCLSVSTASLNIIFEKISVVKSSWISTTTTFDRSESLCALRCFLQNCFAFLFDEKNRNCQLVNDAQIAVHELDDVITVFHHKPDFWHLTVGGFLNGCFAEVELHNWYTGHKCYKAPLPVSKAGSSGTFFENSPIICGGIDNSYTLSTSCFTYKNGGWIQISSLQIPAKFANMIVVPGQGLYLFGSNVPFQLSSQKLSAINSSWAIGQVQIRNYVAWYGHCTVQINDNVTAFLGGSMDNQQIVLYNWSTNNLTSNSNQLIGKRLFSSCAIITTIKGDSVVAIAGGEFLESKGMEIWNPKDGTVTMLTDLLPQETTKSVGLMRATMLSIKDGSELLLYGGKVDGVTLSGIWKYVVSKNTWTKLGDLLKARAEHVTMAVTGIACP